MKWLRPVDRTSGTLTLSAGTLSCLAHHGTPLSRRCPTTAALEHTTVSMDNADRMPPLGAVKPRQKLFDNIHRGCLRVCCTAGFRAGFRPQWVTRVVSTNRKGLLRPVSGPAPFATLPFRVAANGSSIRARPSASDLHAVEGLE